MQSVSAIRNPLTIIAIFAGLAEISGTVVLPSIAGPNQLLFIYFLIGFPTLLILLFFGTLNFNHKVLYAPSDYKSEENFLHSLRPASLRDVVAKVHAETIETHAAGSSSTTEAVNEAQRLDNAGEPAESPLHQRLVPAVQRSNEVAFNLVEAAVLKRVAERYSKAKDIFRNVTIADTSKLYTFDAIVSESDLTTFVEIVYSQHALPSWRLIRDTINRMKPSFDALPKAIPFQLLFIVVSTASRLEGNAAMNEYEARIKEYAISTVDFWYLTESELGLNVP